MRITVNGEPRDVAPGLNVRELIDALFPKGAPCAAEVNKEVVPRREHPNRILNEGDSVEIVALVGGG